MEHKTIIKIDFMLVVGTVLVFASLMYYAQPLVIAPLDNLETTNTSILFSFDKADVILIDDNIEFTSPERIYAENNLVINFKPGKYYWKLQGLMSSEVRNLTINSEVSLILTELQNEYLLSNAGNVPLKVEVYEGEQNKNNLSLIVDEEKNVSGTKFIGEQNDK